MNRRFLSLNLPDLPIARQRQAARRAGRPFPDDDAPLALVGPGPRGALVTAASAGARALGIRAGMNIADAKATSSRLELRDADPAADRKALLALADWCLRYTPMVALDGPRDLMLDITGCTHLFHGEAGLVRDLRRRLARHGLRACIAIAGRQAHAWAFARFDPAPGDVALPGDLAMARLARLPVAALRLEPPLVARLGRVGLRKVGDVLKLPRATLPRRFGRYLVERIDAVTGAGKEVFVPLREARPLAAFLGWPDPIGRTDDIEAGVARLLGQVTEELVKSGEGAREIALHLYRPGAAALHRTIAISRPSRDVAHLRRLFAREIDGLDIGFGIEAMRLEVTRSMPMEPDQKALPSLVAGREEGEDEAALGQLIDRLVRRFGDRGVLRYGARESHVPERAQTLLPAGEAVPAPASWMARMPRPLRLLPAPRRIDAMAAVPDGPPLKLVDGGKVRAIVEAIGPERIAPEWWRLEKAGRQRDYYRLTDADGRDLWVFRAGRFGETPAPAWYLHGLFD